MPHCNQYVDKQFDATYAGAMYGNKKRRGRPRSDDSRRQVPPTSFRINPKLRFGLDLLAKQLRTDKIGAIEHGIVLGLRELGLSRDWQSLYDDDPLLAELRKYTLTEYEVDELEKKRRSFVFAHSRFFYVDKERLTPHGVFARILWPKLDEYMREWHEHLHDDYTRAAKLMAADIKKAGKKPPAIEG